MLCPHFPAHLPDGKKQIEVKIKPKLKTALPSTSIFKLKNINLIKGMSTAIGIGIGIRKSIGKRVSLAIGIGIRIPL